MKIGGEYRVQRIGLSEWRRLASDLTIDPVALLDRIVRMARSIPDAARDVAHRSQAAGLKHEVIERLSMRLTARSRLCLQQLQSTKRTGRRT
jgi:serine/threonine-protein kinase HipA